MKLEIYKVASLANHHRNLKSAPVPTEAQETLKEEGHCVLGESVQPRAWKGLHSGWKKQKDNKSRDGGPGGYLCPID